MSGLEITIIIALFLSMSVQLYFYLILFRKRNEKTAYNTAPLTPISVIIAARNASTELEKNLTAILEQDYPEFEVIVTLDQTTDNSLQILETFATKYKNLKVLNNLSIKPGKKAALTNAIKNSKYEYLLFTDADCRPVSKIWIKMMAGSFSDKKQLILGVGLYEQEPDMLNAFIRYDAQLIALQYSAAALDCSPYMGVGRNLAYTKSLWQKNSGFDKHIDLQSGDDDLFVIEAGTLSNTAVCFDSAAITLSPSKNTIKDFYKQKSRHISSSVKYNFVSKFLSGGELISRSLFILSVIIGLSTSIFYYLIFTYLLRSIIVVIRISHFSRKINNPIPIYHIIIFDIFAPFFYGSLFIYKLLIYNNKEW